MKNKKGLIGILILFIVPIIFIAILSYFFIKSLDFKFYIIGTAILVLSLIYGLSGKVNREKSILAIFFAFIGIILLLLPSLGILQTIFGSSFMSISKIDNIGVGSEFLIYGQAGKGAEDIAIEWSASDLTDAIQDEGENYMVDRGVYADIKLTQWDHLFQITANDNYFYTVGIQDIYPYSGYELSCDLSDCTSKVPQEYQKAHYIDAYAYSTLIGSKCKCIYYEEKYAEAGFLSGASTLDFILKFTLEGKSDFMKPSDPIVSLANGNFRAEYNGNLGTDYQLSAPNYNVVLAETTQYLVMENAASYNNIDSPSSHIKSCLPSSKPSWTDSKVNTCLQAYVNDVNYALRNKNEEYRQIVGAELIGVSKQSLLVRDVGRLTYLPTFKIFINADWVGLKELSGDPDITDCADNATFSAGGQEEYTITVRNKGDEDGYFIYSSTCTDNSVSASAGSVYLEPSESQNVKVLLSSSTALPDDIYGSCTHKFTDSKKTSNYDTCSQPYHILKGSGLCSPGELQCNPTDITQILRCPDDGSLPFELYSTCPEDTYCGYLNGEVKCLGAGQGDVADKEACEQKAREQPWMGWRWIVKTETPSLLSKTITILTFGLIGDLSSTTTASCEATFLKWYVLIGIILIFIAIIFFLLKKPSKGRKRK